MYKLTSLKNTLTEAVPVLKANPEKLQFSVDNGRVVSTLAASLSYENQYRLNLTIAAFSGALETLFVPIQAWRHIHQADMMAPREDLQNGFIYVAQMNDDDSLDITISLLLTERIRVQALEGELLAEYAPEPQPPAPVTRPMMLYVHGELVSEWQE